MSGEFWVGMALIPTAFVVYLALKTLYALTTKAWYKLHVRLLTKVDMKANPVAIRFRGTPPEPKRPKYEDSANYMRDALLTSPRFWLFNGLGWFIIVGRDSKAKPEMQ
jgi:hypothetical protein